MTPTYHDYRRGIFIGVWCGGHVVHYGPYDSLAEALAEAPAALNKGGAGAAVTLTGTCQESGEDFDAMEPSASDTAASILRERRQDREDYRRECLEEQSRCAGMVWGDRGLADYY